MKRVVVFLTLVATLLAVLSAPRFNERPSWLPEAAGAWAWTHGTAAVGCGATPSAASGVGYNACTFQIGVGTSHAFSTSTIDSSQTNNAGFMLYFLNWFGFSNVPTTFVINGDGTVTHGAVTGTPGQSAAGGLTTAAQLGSTPYYRGTAFGGGFYACAKFKILNPSSINTNNGWPNWWAFGIEHVQANGAGTGVGYDQWIGASPSTTEHWAEIDFIEYFYNGFGDDPNYYFSTSHDWWTSGNDASQTGYNPGSSSFTSYHEYCTLWVPATGSTNGYTLNYYDGTAVRTYGTAVTWTQFVNNGTLLPPPTGQTWLQGIADLQHMALTIAGSSDANVQIQYLKVWQASAANNISN